MSKIDGKDQLLYIHWLFQYIYLQWKRTADPETNNKTKKLSNLLSCSSHHSVMKQTNQKLLHLRRRRTIYGAWERLIVHMWASPLYGLWLAAGKMRGGNSLHMQASVYHCGKNCIGLQPTLFLSTSWTLAGTLMAVGAIIILRLLWDPLQEYTNGIWLWKDVPCW